MHLKLQKFSLLCKDLNDEAAIRNEEAIALHQELELVRSERDQIEKELELAQARIALFERDEEERRKAERILREYERSGLEGAWKAIQVRDSIISDLSSRLERALDTLEIEREQQRQRRQIIFPSPRTSCNGDGRYGEDHESELKNVKDALRESQAVMEVMRNDYEKKERNWMIRIENLERQLDTARAHGQFR